MSFDTVRIAFRSLWKQPGFTTVVVLSLALSIALNSTMYGVLDALIHPRVDIREPDRLFKIRFYGDYHYRVSTADRDSLLRAGAPSIVATGWYDPVSEARTTLIVAGSNYAETRVGGVSADYFSLMQPVVISGRLFRGDDDARTIVLGEQLAKELFPGADPRGGVVTLDDTSYTVVGVLSRYAAFPGSRAAAWVLAKPKAHETYARVVRVRAGTTRDQLDRELQVVARRIAGAAGDSYLDDAFRIAMPTREQAGVAVLHRALVVAVLSVLFVVCANVANMQLARGISRGRELALRAALGASRRRIIVHLLTEISLLAVAGLLLGLVLTYWAAVALKATIPPAVGDYIVEPQLNWRMLLFAVGAMVACILLVGLFPAVKVSRADPNEMLKRGHGTGSTRANRRQYGYLVVVEMGFALALVSAAVVTVRGAIGITTMTFWSGFDVRPLATGAFPRRAAEVAGRPFPEVLAEMQRSIEALPGVAGASIEVNDNYENAGVTIADSSGARELKAPGYGYRLVTPSFIRTRRMAIIAGRDFIDGERDQPAILIDELTARRLWPNANPVGALMKLGDSRSNRPFARVVGVFTPVDPDGQPKPASMTDLLDGTIGAVLYLPGLRDTVHTSSRGLVAIATARANNDPAPVAIAMRRIGVRGAMTMDMWMGLSKTRIMRGFMAKLFSLFGVIGLGLAMFGVYGVVAHSVAERRRELGVRVALGATPRDILRAVLRESLAIALAGIALGLFLVAQNIRLVGQFSTGDDVFSAPLFAAISVVLLGVVTATAFVPARRATLIDPTESLRSE